MEPADIKTFTFIIYCCLGSIFVCVGIWESIIASTYQDIYTYSTSLTEAYAFTVIKSIINILINICGCCLLAASDDDKSNKSNQLQFINFGVSIWGCVMYTNMKSNNNLFGPFSKVIYAEFIIFISSICLFVLLIIISFCGLCFINKPKNNDIEENIARINESRNAIQNAIRSSMIEETKTETISEQKLEHNIITVN